MTGCTGGFSPGTAAVLTCAEGMPALLSVIIVAPMLELKLPSSKTIWTVSCPVECPCR